ncbi:uncharacterized protein LOC124813866 [Hydra vulgaris]|uniref:uncharacterized protein LOC124813866 n=1 Tax=Hydra vulgaris TaxID=6087 RepID=UPI001F5ECDD8|nr:uncharacterized protein LOC124813866 [Hydra vulgaris]
MPGRNCCLPQCTVSDTNKHKDIGLFQISIRKDEYHTIWRKKLIDFLAIYRPLDGLLKERITKGNVYFCEKHFSPEDIEFTKTGRKTLRLGVVPTLNLPVKSHPTTKPTERRHLNIVKDRTTINKNAYKPVYNTFEEFKMRIQKLKLNEWEISIFDETVLFKHMENPFLLSKFEVFVDTSLDYSCIVFGWSLPVCTELYKLHSRSLKNITISLLLQELLSYNICDGIRNISSTDLLLHTVSCKTNFNHIIDGSPPEVKTYFRSSDCFVCVKGQNQCLACENFILKYEFEKTKLNVPLEFAQCNMQNDILNKSIVIGEELKKDIATVMESNAEKLTPFLKLFWDEQKKAACCHPNAVKYHPMIIRFCLSLCMKSASAYDELRSSSILTLPSSRTLRDYKNAIKPSAGFNSKVIEELIKTSSKLKDHQRFVTLSFDEIKIQSDLVFDKHSGDLIGYVDLGDPDLNYCSFPDLNELAKHVFVYYVRGLSSDLKYALAFFATKDTNASQIFKTFWEAVLVLEVICKLSVVACVSDGASANRKFYKMHEYMDNCIDEDLVYRTVNIYAPERYIWFFADAPHLMKTLRNCIFNSGNGKKSRFLWNNGKEICWTHIKKIVDDELSRGLKLIPKLTMAHVDLNPYSVMRVNLACQVLSKSVSNIIFSYYPQEMHATAELCYYMDSFFDCLNVRNQSEGTNKRKDFLKPFTSISDPRFFWLKNCFLKYFENWRQSISIRQGFSDSDKEKMFISSQTFEGLKITSKSVIEATQFLLTAGMPFVLTEKFNQDVVEEYFGRHRSMGFRNENPNVYQFGYQSNAIRMQRSVVPVTGNTRGKQKRYISWDKVDDELIQKRK